MGAIRSSGLYIHPEKNGIIHPESLIPLKRHIEHEIVHIIRYVLRSNIIKAYGSSGTILSLEAIAGAYKPLINHHIAGFLATSELETVISYLTALSLQERREIQGLNPDRADIIIGGATILCEILKAAQMKGIYVSSRSLRDGLLVDYISRIPGFPHAEQVNIRERSIKHLAKSCQIDEEHATHIVSLCKQLFYSGKKIGLFKYSDEVEELLSHAAYLHDVGQFISFSNHHHHSCYLITEASLLGFNQHEILIMALVARYHRKKLPRNRDYLFQDLNRTDRRMIRIVSLLLRFAENLDRSHDHRVTHVEFKRNKNNISLIVTCNQDCSLEIWAVESERDAFFRTFQIPLDIKKSEGKRE